MEKKTRAQEHAEAVAAAEEWARGKSAAQMMAEFRQSYADYIAGRPPRKPAEVVEFPPKLDQAELWRRQAALDAAWERTLDARAELEAERAASCHRGSGDRDYVRDGHAFVSGLYFVGDVGTPDEGGK
jgi:hypothetical protein